MFSKCSTIQETKDLYRKLAKFLHPDFGGSNELMSLLTNAYDDNIKMIQYFKQMEEEEKKEQQQQKPKEKTKAKSAYEKQFEDVFQEEEEKLEIITEIIEYAKTHPKFNTDYVLSMSEFLEERGYITSMQYNSLVNIYYSFRMDKLNIKPEKTNSKNDEKI